MTRTKVAVVGVGSLGEHHARTYSQAPEAELVAVVDLDGERAARVASEFGCQAFRNFREIAGMVEAASLAAPTADHAEIGVALLEEGIHVLVEKPIARDLPGADLLIQAAARGNRVLRVGHSERFNPALLAVRPLIRRPRFFEAHRLGIFVPRGLDVDVVLDLMIHDLDLILHLVDSPLQEVRAVGIPVITPRVDIANARLEFQNGCVANLTASRVSKEKIRKLRLFQAHDYVSIDFHGRAVEMFSLLQQEGGYQIREREFSIAQDSPLHMEISDFLSQVRGGERTPNLPAGCTGPEGRRSLELALRILGAIEAGSPTSPGGEAGPGRRLPEVPGEH